MIFQQISTNFYEYSLASISYKRKAYLLSRLITIELRVAFLATKRKKILELRIKRDALLENRVILRSKAARRVRNTYAVYETPYITVYIDHWRARVFVQRLRSIRLS